MRRILPTKKGFTLVELVVITPMIILLIGALVGVIVFMTSSSLRSQARSQLQLDVLSALDRIEQDVKVSTALGTSTTTLQTTNLATSKNPLDSGRQLIRASDCSVATGGIPLDSAMTYQTNYSIQGSSYVRQVVLSGSCASNSNVWQKSVTEDLIKNATVSVSIQYFTNGSTNRNTVRITITASRRVSGEDVNYTGSMYVRSLNIL